MNPVTDTQDPEPNPPDAPRAEEGAEPPAGADASDVPEGFAAAIAATEAPARATPDFRDRWLRAEAELQNFRRRAQREWDEARRSAEERMMLEMVAVIDDLERAVGAAREAGAPPGWTQGVSLTVQRLLDYLQRNGVTPEDPVGQRFDPRFHEALLEIEAPPGVEPGAVVQVTAKGYRRGDRALRAARVVVARGPAGSQS